MQIIRYIFNILTGGHKLYFGGGGGSSAPKTPDKTTQTVVNIPPYARPYVESLLGRSEALTTGAQYEPYSPSERFAGIDPLQQQAYDAAGNLSTAPELDQAGNLVGQAMQQSQLGSQYADMLMGQGLGYGAQGFNTGQQYQQNLTDPSAIQSHMSPYMQNVIDIQKQEAIRDYQKQMPQLQSAATQAGAYGGSRQAILEAEAMRNLNQNLGDIQARGQQQAYTDAMQNMYQGAQMGMQGAQTGLQGVGQGINAAQLGQQTTSNMLQGAGQLGQLGSTRFGQQTGILDAQQALGGMMQQQDQQRRDFDYQQFVDELNFPYQQLAFMSDMTQGLPLSQSTVYQNSAQQQMGLPQLLGLGMQGYGLANRAKGGKINKPVRKYADGGQVEPVPAEPAAFDGMRPDEVQEAISLLSDEQLMQYLQFIEDQTTLTIIQQELRKRERLRGDAEVNPEAGAQGVAPAAGLGAVPQTGLRMQDQVAQQVPPPQMQPMAAGGLVDIYNKTNKLRNGPIKGTSKNVTISYDPADIRDLKEMPYHGPSQITEDPIGPQITEDLPVDKSQDTRPTNVVEPFLPGERPSGEIPLPVDYFGVNNESLGDPSIPDSPVASDTQEPQSKPARGPSSQGSSILSSLIGQSEDNPAMPNTFEEYKDAINQQADVSLHEQMLMDAMRSGLDERQAQLEARDRRGKMDALIAAGAAMMRGRNLAEGLTYASEAGAQALQEATAARDAYEESINEAQQQQYMYELSLARDDRKMAREAYQSYLDYNQRNVKMAQDYQLATARLGLMAQRNEIAAAGGAGGLSMKDYATIQKQANDVLAKTPEALAMAELVKSPGIFDKNRQEIEAAYNARRDAIFNSFGLGAAAPDFGITGARRKD